MFENLFGINPENISEVKSLERKSFALEAAKAGNLNSCQAQNMAIHLPVGSVLEPLTAITCG